MMVKVYAVVIGLCKQSNLGGTLVCELGANEPTCTPPSGLATPNCMANYNQRGIEFMMYIVDIPLLIASR